MWNKLLATMLVGIMAMAINACGGDDEISGSVDTDTDTDTDTDADTDKDLKNMWECLICGDEAD